MLSVFRKYAKSNIVKALYVVLAISFFGGFGILGNRYFRQEREQKGESADTVFTVNGEKIPAQEFQKAYEQAKKNWMARMEKMYGKVPEDMLDAEALKKDVMDNLVNQTLLLQEAKKMGVKVSSADVNTEIGQIPYFRDESGQFSPDRYRNILNNLQVTPEEFEKEIEERLKINRVVNMIVAPVQVDDQELKSYYERVKSEINLSFFSIDAAERYKDLKPTKEEIDQYYKTHTAEFDWPEMRKLRYIQFPIANFEKNVKLTDAELKDYYEKAKDRHPVSPEQGRFRHILVKVDPKASESEVKKAKEKAEKILIEARTGGDFAELAKKYSDDPGSAAQGGDLGFQNRGAFVPEFESAGYALKPGQVSDLVRSSFGFHIIKLEELKSAEYQPLAKVKSEITKDLTHAKALDLAKQNAEQVQKDCMKLGMEKAAKKDDLKVVASDLFKKRENALDAPDSADLTEQAFYMKPGEISEVIAGVDDFYIIEVTDIKDPHRATLEEASARIAKTLKPELQLKKTKADARKWLEDMKKGATINAEAAKAGASVKDTGFFSKGARRVPEIGLANEDFSKVIFNLSLKNPVPDDAYDSGAKVYVMRVKAEKPADMDKFATDGGEVKQELLEKKQQQAFDKFVEDKKTGKVTVVDAVYKKIQ